MNQRLGLRCGFDFVIMSYEVGASKPEKRIFEILVETAGLAPEQILFIDDTASYAEAVRASGVQFLHFRSAAQLRDDLHLHGIWF